MGGGGGGETEVKTGEGLAGIFYFYFFPDRRRSPKISADLRTAVKNPGGRHSVTKTRSATTHPSSLGAMGWQLDTIKHEGTFGPESRQWLHVYKTHSNILNQRRERRNSNFKSDFL